MAKAIMVQGTMSNAGKSILVSALCHIFKQDGRKVAPFKSQNMALNSFITRDGLEMGRAQVTQAEAAGVEPDVRMNPILLKPEHDQGSQVILHGEVWDTVTARNYYAMKSKLVPEVMKAYDSLASEFDIIVIEGAGSAAELNLAKDDFVNMGMAKMAKTPVLLVGDIDRGGIFAQLYGTVKVLPDDESALIKALIVNKFRGDISLFDDGVTILEDICGKPVAGVVPYLNVDIDDEDSPAERMARKREHSVLDIAVIFLPHISNFTDFAALEATPDVKVRYVKEPYRLGNPDLVIIPGSKSTIFDMLRLRECGLEAAVKQLANRGVPILGICGGYQILGASINDSEGAEGGGAVAGMNLLPVATEFAAEKHRTRVTAAALEIGGIFAPLTGSALEGYEIHMGVSTLKDGAKPLLKLSNGTLDGCWFGNVYGTYLHGFFDSTECRDAILGALCKSKGVTLSAGAFDFAAHKERNYDLLAQGVRDALDMRLIYRILEEGALMNGIDNINGLTLQRT
ncbi:MAG: cobyric acid synthase [Synergistaceae bacterium]|jgi:adenosylcobyric acid synthase|nr:cobyric acid synthase [Synergistaceae bacterium]